MAYVPTIEELQFAVIIIDDTDSPFSAGAQASIVCNATNGAITVNLPAVATSANRTYYITKSDASANAITVDGNGAETINGNATVIISNQYDTINIICDGTVWYIVASAADTIAITGGGTGQTAKQGAFDALSPVTTKGDIIVRDGSNNIRLPIGADDQVLTADSSQTSGLKWAAGGAGGGAKTILIGGQASSNNFVVSKGSTEYVAPFGSEVAPTQARSKMYVTDMVGTLKNLKFTHDTCGGTASDTSSIIVQINGIDTNILDEVTGTSAFGLGADLVNTASLTTNASINLKLVNGYTGGGAQDFPIVSWTLEIEV